MKLNKKSIRLTAAMVGCIVLLAVCARVTDDAVPASAAADDRPVIVVDAGQGGYALSEVAI